MNDKATRLWTDRSRLRDGQYRTDANLAARQSIYAYQYPKLDLPALVFGQVALTGDETVADIGCGNGAYFAAPGPVENYVRSMHSAQDLPDPGSLAAAVASRIPRDQEPFCIRTQTGCLICS